MTERESLNSAVLLAAHEGGHALLAYLMGGRPHSAWITDGAGAIQDDIAGARDYAGINFLAVLAGGKAAEETFCDHIDGHSALEQIRQWHEWRELAKASRPSPECDWTRKEQATGKEQTAQQSLDTVLANILAAQPSSDEERAFEFVAKVFGAHCRFRPLWAHGHEIATRLLDEHFDILSELTRELLTHRVLSEQQIKTIITRSLAARAAGDGKSLFVKGQDMTTTSPEFPFIADSEGRHDLRRQRAAEAYRGFIAKAAQAGDLSPEDAAALEDVAQILGIPWKGEDRSVSSDCRTYKKWLNLNAKLATEAERKAAQAAAEAAICAYDAETVAIIEPRQQEMNRLLLLASQARKAAEELLGLRQEIAALEHQHWAVLGLEDPAIVGRRKHLVHGYRDVKLPDDCITFESLVGIGYHDSRSLDYDWTPAEGQSEAEMQELLNAARESIGNGRRVRYLISEKCPAGEIAWNGEQMTLRYEDLRAELENRERRPQFRPDGQIWVRLPGQDKAAFEEMLTKLQNMHDNNVFIKRDRELRS